MPDARRPPEPASARTLLFVPGSRPDRFAKAARSSADLVVLDLEDAVAPDGKHAARDEVRRYLESGATAAVRVNAMHTDWHADDLRAVAEHAAALMIPKAEAGASLAELAGRLQDLRKPLLALVETAAGVLDARAVAATAGVARLAFGSFDLATQLGVDPLDEQALGPHRTALVLASAAAGLPGPIDGVRARLDDDAGLRDEAAQARRLGFTGKLCIHPRQVAIVDEVLAPTPDEIAWATRVVEALGDHGGVTSLDGAMVDRPVVERARRILENRT